MGPTAEAKGPCLLSRPARDSVGVLDRALCRSGARTVPIRLLRCCLMGLAALLVVHSVGD